MEQFDNDIEEYSNKNTTSSNNKNDTIFHKNVNNNLNLTENHSISDEVQNGISRGSIIRNNTELFDRTEIQNHHVVNTKNFESSIEPIKISLNEAGYMKSKSVEKSSYKCIDDIKSLNFEEIYILIISAPMIIFVDNYKLNNRCKFKRKKRLFLSQDFQGCLFLPFEYSTILKKNLRILNNDILKNEANNKKFFYKDYDIDYCICFDEGEILKDCVYKKLEIINKMLFISVNKYQIKLTEYKIRGFCQMVEELGAKNIKITFKKNDTVIKKKQVDINIGTDIEILAGGLGLSNSNEKENSEDYKYTLSYPDNNNLLLNEKSIRKKINNKRFIISQDIFNSSLELQYLIRSRCRHFITEYSTIFSFDNKNVIDKKLSQKFKAYKINTGLEYSYKKEKSYFLQIKTDVKFSDQEDYLNNLFGYSVSLDKIGFNFLLDSLKNDEHFETNGIFKIMDFINLYITKVYKTDKYYPIVNQIKDMIKKNLTINEYAKLLCIHFNKSSHWIHFKNYIDLLANKTHTYDKLGYLIIMNNNDLSIDDRFEVLLKFVQKHCILKDIENNFWKMLQPQNKELEYFLKNKLINEYDFIRNYNWYSLNCLLKNIELYVISFDDLVQEDIFLHLKNNMKIGYQYYEFQNNLLPFIIKKAHSLHYKSNNSKYLSSLFSKSINYESFIISHVNNLSDLEEYIINKINKIDLISKLISDFKKTLKNNNELYTQQLKGFSLFLKSDNFKYNYKYFNKKLNIILPNLDKKYIDELLDYNKINNINKLITNTCEKLICYNEKLNINNIPIDNNGFILVINRFKFGIKEVEFEIIIKPFITKLINNVILSKYPLESCEYKSIIKFNIFKELTLEKFKNYNNNFYDLLVSITNIIDNNLKCSPSTNLLKYLII
uniref:Uncharacterized protein n=1 Tax=viral metagenome TaxID=1070528 RepID=A0A6C0J3L1_9ZZZZ